MTKRHILAILLLLAAVPAAHAQFGRATSLRGKPICSDISPNSGDALVWDGVNNCYKSGTVSSGPSDLGTLTYNASGTTTFAAASAPIAGGVVTVTHATSSTFSPTNLVKWGSYTLKILQDSTGGGATLTLGTAGACSAWKVIGGGSGAITLSTAANAIDILAFTFDGTNCIANFGALAN